MRQNLVYYWLCTTVSGRNFGGFVFDLIHQPPSSHVKGNTTFSISSVATQVKCRVHPVVGKRRSKREQIGAGSQWERGAGWLCAIRSSISTTILSLYMYPERLGLGFSGI